MASRRTAIVAAAILLTASVPRRATAHPLGNDSITHFSVIYLYPDRIELDFLLDIAEQESTIAQREEIDADRDGDDTEDEQKAWLERKAQEFLPYLKFTLDGRPLALTTVQKAPAPAPTTGPAAPTTAPAEKTAEAPKQIIIKIPGFAGFPTYRLLVRYAAPLPALGPGANHVLTYTDETYPQTRGLKRVILERPDTVEIVERNRQFWDEGTDPFVYEQYDPGNMPAERDGRVVFRVSAEALAKSDKQVTPEPAEPAPATQPTVPAGATTEPGPAQPDVGRSATAGPGGASAPATAPTTAPVDGQPRHDPWERMTDPRNDPAAKDVYRQQASRVVALMNADLSLGVLALIAVLSFAYGAYHSLLPGHAKTIVAAYLISRRGTYVHAVLLALVVTLTHTALVVVVGLVFLEVSPRTGSRVQLWLGVAAGAIIAVMGGWLVFRALTGRLHHHHSHDDDAHPHSHAHPHGHEHSHSDGHAHAHAHDHGHAHDHTHAHDHEHHHDHGHAHGHAHAHRSPLARPHGIRAWLRMLFTHSHPELPVDEGASAHEHTHVHAHEHAHVAAYARSGAAMADAVAGPRLTTGLVLWLGISGGIVPCPAATLIMLAAIAQGRVAIGLYAVGAFSLGLALTLMAVGFLALSSRRYATRLMGEEGSQRWLLTILPAIGGAAVVGLGSLIIVDYVARLTTGQSLIPFLG